MSEAGCPGVADPGAVAVQIAHEMGIRVCPLVGPSSILLGLMASGFSGQSFIFHGYLPIDKIERQKSLKNLEKAPRNSKRRYLWKLLSVIINFWKIFYKLVKAISNFVLPVM
jgi:16S rRNA (cytidine1402-2'-O)-methyltransferase